MKSMIACGLAATFAIAGPMLATAAHAGQNERLFGLTHDHRVVTFASNTPGVITSNRAITGLAAGERLIGIDLRATDRKLYTMGTSGSVYRLEGGAGGYAAINLGQISTPLTGSSFGFDFNPVPNRLRVVSDANQNLRLNPMASTVGTIVDRPLTLNGAPVIDLLAVAYTNNRAGARSTVLYGLDARSGGLVRALNANEGTYVTTNLAGQTFQPLGLPFDNSEIFGFDISGGTGQAFFNHRNSLYRLDLANGTPSFVGDIGAGSLAGLTAGSVPEPSQWAMMLAGFGLVGLARRRQRPPRSTLLRPALA